MVVSSLHVYPIKSCKGISLKSATFGPRCFQYDRHWIIVDAEGSKLTQRDEPRLALIETDIHDDTLTMSAEGCGRAHVSIREVPEQSRNVDVWGDDSPGLIERAEASQWLSEFLHQPVTLLRFDESKRRDVVPEWGGGESGAHIAFNDCLPVLITNSASLDALNEWRGEEGLEPSPMDRFRPNIVVTGPDAWEEDSWPAVKGAGGIHIDITRPCSRCAVTNVDQRAGSPEPRGNLHVLSDRRLFRNYLGRQGAYFGVQGITTKCEGETLSLNDVLEPCEQSMKLPDIPRFL